MRVEVVILDPRVVGWGFPHYGSEAAAGLDLHAALDAPVTLEPGVPARLIPTGIAIHIADAGWCGLVVPRSGLGHRAGLALGNTVGVIDADYEGPLMISVWNRGLPPAPPIRIEPGERVAQLVFTRVVRPRLRVAEADPSAPGSIRGAGGFGSTGL